MVQYDYAVLSMLQGPLGPKGPKGPVGDPGRLGLPGMKVHILCIV